MARYELSDNEKSVRASIAANERWARTADRTANGERGQAGLQARFEKQVDPDGTLDPEIRARMAENAKAAHFKRMQLASAKARSRNKRIRDGEEAE
ncbi:hypothetical protein GCM10007079_33150 [Nocardiopsis terrae]|uniref:Lsr2 protein n=1 Tax=Nocardiopsis terrae TaxID=372655 RepID=A0ABR9HJE6_9ACTN|nr:hypothetical protein [Nocardiopsis terrae]MBE1459128.1 hypothetical protein [Nocardiopsis terrae]GHC88300.1 hypothetical protein GCM10007079_33150 [Nocardiopsis terrae]